MYPLMFFQKAIFWLSTIKLCQKFFLKCQNFRHSEISLWHKKYDTEGNTIFFPVPYKFMNLFPTFGDLSSGIFITTSGILFAAFGDLLYIHIWHGDVIVKFCQIQNTVPNIVDNYFHAPNKYLKIISPSQIIIWQLFPFPNIVWQLHANVLGINSRPCGINFRWKNNLFILFLLHSRSDVRFWIHPGSDVRACFI